MEEGRSVELEEGEVGKTRLKQNEELRWGAGSVGVELEEGEVGKAGWNGGKKSVRKERGRNQ